MLRTTIPFTCRFGWFSERLSIRSSTTISYRSIWVLLVDVREIADRIWQLSWLTYDLGFLDKDEDRLEPDPIYSLLRDVSARAQQQMSRAFMAEGSVDQIEVGDEFRGTQSQILHEQPAHEAAPDLVDHGALCFEG